MNNVTVLDNYDQKIHHKEWDSIIEEKLLELTLGKRMLLINPWADKNSYALEFEKRYDSLIDTIYSKKTVKCVTADISSVSEENINVIISESGFRGPCVDVLLTDFATDDIYGLIQEAIGFHENFDYHNPTPFEKGNIYFTEDDGLLFITA